MSKPTFYLTTTLPYVNASPHIGFAQEIIAADVIARYQRSQDKDVIFNTGTDEHGQKIYEKALESNQSPQAYTDFYAATFGELKTLLNLSYNRFIRTTNPEHKAAAQEFWLRCKARGDIYKKEYETKYCVGCELEKQASDLVDGRCPLHPDKELELRSEENYFFRFSNYQAQLLELYAQEDAFVQPESKLKEIRSFVERGLEDFSISRLKSKMPWGVPVPNDDEHVMYVWFDALVNYISTLGWPTPKTDFDTYWPGIQLCGKDNLRQQSAMWQAMLFSAGVEPSKKILVNGFISVDGQKMSKSLGNVISPVEMVERYGTDATRYLLMNLGPFGNDMDVTWEKFDTTYTADLVNGYGNLCSRIINLAARSEIQSELTVPQFSEDNLSYYNRGALDTFDISFDVQVNIKSSISDLDKYLSEHTPWTKTGEEKKNILQQALQDLYTISCLLHPYMPHTCETIIHTIEKKTLESIQPLFPRLQPVAAK